MFTSCLMKSVVLFNKVFTSRHTEPTKHIPLITSAVATCRELTTVSALEGTHLSSGYVTTRFQSFFSMVFGSIYLLVKTSEYIAHFFPDVFNALFFSLLVSFICSVCFGVRQGSLCISLTLFLSCFISVGGCPENPEWLSALHLFCL